MPAKRFNLKLSFRGGRVYRIEHGDFGATDSRGASVRNKPPTEDCLVAWPLPPEHTGKSGILALLGVASHDNVEFIKQGDRSCR